jgi:hypothetical protein
MYYLAFVGLAVIGLVYDGYFFAFHLLHIIVGNDILLRVTQVRCQCISGGHAGSG